MEVQKVLGASVISVAVVLSVLATGQAHATEVAESQADKVVTPEGIKPEQSNAKTNNSEPDSQQTVAEAQPVAVQAAHPAADTTMPSSPKPTPQPIPPTDDSQTLKLELILEQRLYQQGDDINLKAKVINLKDEAKLKLAITTVKPGEEQAEPELIDIEERAEEIDLTKYIKDKDLPVGSYRLELLAEKKDDATVVLAKSDEVVVNIIAQTPAPQPIPKQPSPIVRPKPITPLVTEVIKQTTPLKVLEPVRSNIKLSTEFSKPHVFAISSTQGRRTAVLPVRSGGSATSQTVKPKVTSTNTDNANQEKSINLPAASSHTEAEDSSAQKDDSDQSSQPDWKAIGVGVGVLGVAAVGCYQLARRK